MSTLLYIKANPKSNAESRTFQISERFIQKYRDTHPQDQVITLDLYRENIKPLTAEEVHLTHRPTETDHPMIRYARQFNAADRYVIAAPLWNLGSPSILKAYLDYIMIVGINFTYTQEGPKGLCLNKKAVHITSRGGIYTQGPTAGLEMADRYLRVILNFLGISDITTIAAEGLDIQGADVTGLVNQAIKQAEDLAPNF